MGLPLLRALALLVVAASCQGTDSVRADFDVRCGEQTGRYSGASASRVLDGGERLTLWTRWADQELEISFERAALGDRIEAETRIAGAEVLLRRYQGELAEATAVDAEVVLTRLEVVDGQTRSSGRVVARAGAAACSSLDAAWQTRPGPALPAPPDPDDPRPEPRPAPDPEPEPSPTRPPPVDDDPVVSGCGSTTDEPSPPDEPDPEPEPEPEAPASSEAGGCEGDDIEDDSTSEDSSGCEGDSVEDEELAQASAKRRRSHRLPLEWTVALVGAWWRLLLHTRRTSVRSADAPRSSMDSA